MNKTITQNRKKEKIKRGRSVGIINCQLLFWAKEFPLININFKANTRISILYYFLWEKKIACYFLLIHTSIFGHITRDDPQSDGFMLNNRQKENKISTVESVALFAIMVKVIGDPYFLNNLVFLYNFPLYE